MKVQPQSKVQPKADYLKAVAKIVEALDPIYYHERERIVKAALILVGNECEAKKLMQP